MTRRRGLRLSVLLVAAAFTALAGLVGQVVAANFVHAIGFTLLGFI